MFQTLDDAYDWVLSVDGHLARNFDQIFDRAFIDDVEYNLGFTEVDGTVYYTWVKRKR